MSQASHVMPITTLPGQLGALWDELGAAQREIERLRQECDALRLEALEWKSLALDRSERMEE
jgi:hypothetical protein